MAGAAAAATAGWSEEAKDNPSAFLSGLKGANLGGAKNASHQLTPRAAAAWILEQGTKVNQ